MRSESPVQTYNDTVDRSMGVRRNHWLWRLRPRTLLNKGEILRRMSLRNNQSSATSSCHRACAQGQRGHNVALEAVRVWAACLESQA
jgi:hypothetical protein